MFATQPTMMMPMMNPQMGMGSMMGGSSPFGMGGNGNSCGCGGALQMDPSMQGKCQQNNQMQQMQQMMQMLMMIMATQMLAQMMGMNGQQGQGGMMGGPGGVGAMGGPGGGFGMPGGGGGFPGMGGPSGSNGNGGYTPQANGPSGPVPRGQVGQGGQAAVDLGRQYLGRNSRDIKGQLPNFTAAGGQTNNCADFVSSLLESTGQLRGHHVGVRNLESQLRQQGYRQIPAGQAKPGDVWISNSRSHTEMVTNQGGTRTIGSNNDRQGHQVISERNKNPNAGVYYTRG